LIRHGEMTHWSQARHHQHPSFRFQICRNAVSLPM
jgi:hypothetical protein